MPRWAVYPPFGYLSTEHPDGLVTGVLVLKMEVQTASWAPTITPVPRFPQTVDEESPAQACSTGISPSQPL